MVLQLKMESLTTALERTATDGQWWEELIRGVSALDLVAIRWISASGTRESVLRQGAARWSLRIPMTPVDAIEIEGGFTSRAHALDLVGFAQMANRTFPSGRSAATVPEPERLAALLP